MKRLHSGMIVATAVALASSALAQDAVYGDDDGCRRATGSGAQGDDLTILTSDSIQFYESSCSIVSTRQLGQQMHHVTSCGGEGETWDATYAVQPLPNAADGFVLWDVTTPEFKTEVRRCR